MNRIVSSLAQVVLISLLFAVCVVYALGIAGVLTSRSASAGPGHGHAGEHGRHKGRPFVSDPMPAELTP